MLRTEGRRGQFMFRQRGTDLNIQYESDKTWPTLDIWVGQAVAMCQCEMGDTGYWENPEVNNNAKMPLWGGFCINLALQSEARAFASTFASQLLCIYLWACVLPLCSLCLAGSHLPSSLCAGE